MTNSSIADRYDLELVPISIDGRRLEVYRIGNLDPVIEKMSGDLGGAIRDFPFWVKVWEAAFILTGHLLRMNLGRSTRILEIGAGMGIASLFLGNDGYPVTVTDADDDALELLEMNARHNGVGNLQVSKLDWLKPDLETQFDLICGSELIYSESAVSPVLHILRNHLAPSGTAITAHDIRRRWLSRFVEEAEQSFEVGHAVNQIGSETDSYRILVTRLKPRMSDN